LDNRYAPAWFKEYWW